MAEPTEPTILQGEIDALRAEVVAMTAERKRANEAQTDCMSRLMYAREIAALKKALRQAVERIEELERRQVVVPAPTLMDSEVEMLRLDARIPMD